MRRPPLTRKKIEAIMHSIGLAQGYCSDPDDPYFAELAKPVDEAREYMLKVSRWHKWKQQQKQDNTVSPEHS